MRFPLLCLALLAPLAISAAENRVSSADGQPALTPFLYRWPFEAGGLSDSEFRKDVRGGQLTLSGGDTDGVPVFQRKGGVSEATPGVLNASRNHYGSSNGAQVNSFGSPLRTSHTLSQFTITMWIKPALPPDKQPYARLINLSSDNNEQAAQGILLALENDSFSFSVNGSPTGKFRITEPVVKTDEWVFLVFCYDGLAENPYSSPNMNEATKSWSNAVILAGELGRPTRLISNDAISTGAPAYNVSPGALSLDGLLVAIGSSNSRYDRSFVGWIDDVRIYSGLLSIAELERVRREATLANATPKENPSGLDRVLIGDAASERAHDLSVAQSETGRVSNYAWRDAAPNGAFSYVLKLPTIPKPVLICTYWGSDRDRTFDVVVNGVVVATQTLEGRQPDKAIEIAYPLPPEALNGQQNLTVRFKGTGKGRVGGLLGLRLEPTRP